MDIARECRWGTRDYRSIVRNSRWVARDRRFLGR
jgi:hypothetical protein